MGQRVTARSADHVPRPESWADADSAAGLGVGARAGEGCGEPSWQSSLHKDSPLVLSIACTLFQWIRSVQVHQRSLELAVKQGKLC